MKMADGKQVSQHKILETILPLYRLVVDTGLPFRGRGLDKQGTEEARYNTRLWRLLQFTFPFSSLASTQPHLISSPHNITSIPLS